MDPQFQQVLRSRGLLAVSYDDNNHNATDNISLLSRIDYDPANPYAIQSLAAPVVSWRSAVQAVVRKEVSVASDDLEDPQELGNITQVAGSCSTHVIHTPDPTPPPPLAP